MKRKKPVNKNDEFIGIAGAVGGLTLAMIVMVGALFQEALWVAVPIVASMACLGIGLGYFASKRR